MLCGQILTVLKIKILKFIWSRNNGIVDCKRNCVSCKYYTQCVEDVVYNSMVEQIDMHTFRFYDSEYAKTVCWWLGGATVKEVLEELIASFN